MKSATTKFLQGGIATADRRDDGIFGVSDEPAIEPL
jgi:hypothetical protein